MGPLQRHKRHFQTLNTSILYLLYFATSYLFDVCSSIHLEAVVVPQYKFRGQNATLLCRYELKNNEQLFSLKWYKEETEFYRFMPRDDLRIRGGFKERKLDPHDDSIQTWKVSGIKIDIEKSRPEEVILKRVGFKSTGMYRCEVTAVVRKKGKYQGIQGFVMKESINRMTVVELPKQLPTILGGEIKRTYKPGDFLNLTCTSAPSNPPAKLQWILNGREIDEFFVEEQYLLNKHRGLFSSVIGLMLPLDESHFENGELRIRCRGTIAAEFWKKDVENVFTEREKIVKVLEIRESQWPNSSGSYLRSSPASFFWTFFIAMDYLLSYNTIMSIILYR
ncbi:uncharacterized protein [Lepeophtheirus salmonis]|nr:uncharacterized protein LOC121124684 [Lepeophtheirus salmonis]XP_040575799.1 uncharacterized protein LOC121124684 [Lepeophtheirus salmonis]